MQVLLSKGSAPLMCLHTRESTEGEFDKYKGIQCVLSVWKDNWEYSEFGFQKHIWIQQKSTTVCTAAKGKILSTLHDGSSVWQSFYAHPN